MNRIFIITAKHCNWYVECVGSVLDIVPQTSPYSATSTYLLAKTEHNRQVIPSTFHWRLDDHELGVDVSHCRLLTPTTNQEAKIALSKEDLS